MTRSEVTWKWVPGYENRYEVSSDGQVRSWLRTGRGSGSSETPYLMKPIPNSANGYLQVVLSDQASKKRGRFIHRMVLEAFKGPGPVGTECAHIDGDRHNNRVENLTWKTRLENMQDQQLHGTAPKGERNPTAKLSEIEVREIRNLRSSGSTLAEIGQRFGVSIATVSNIANRKVWKHV